MPGLALCRASYAGFNRIRFQGSFSTATVSMTASVPLAARELRVPLGEEGRGRSVLLPILHVFPENHGDERHDDAPENRRPQAIDIEAVGQARRRQQESPIHDE
jgi:hypothetical protein